MTSKGKPDYIKAELIQRKTIKMPDISGLTVDRASDETGSFVKSDMDRLKVHKVLSRLRPFSQRSQEEIMEFICYMFEQTVSSNETVCQPTERNRCFYFVASGQLLHRQSGTGASQGKMLERRLTELDCWGLECLCTGQDQRISVTACSSCRLFVLTSRRFYWLCQMSARRTHKLLLETVAGLSNQLNSVQLALGLPDVPTNNVQVAREESQLHVMQDLPQEPERPEQQQQQQQPTQLALQPTKSNIKRLLKAANLQLLNGLLYSIRQLEMPAHRQDKSEQSVMISSSSSQPMILYCLSGVVNLVLDQSNDIINSVMEQNAILSAGQTFEIAAKEKWKLTNGSSTQKQHQKIIVYLIDPGPMERSSDSYIV